MHRQRPDLTLRVCHRLDRLTSGLTIFAKTAERAGVIQKQIGERANARSVGPLNCRRESCIRYDTTHPGAIFKARLLCSDNIDGAQNGGVWTSRGEVTNNVPLTVRLFFLE